MLCGVGFRRLTMWQQMDSHLSLVQVSANRTSRSERAWVLGCSESTVMIRNPCLVNASFASEGRPGVDMMTSGCLDPTRLKLSFNTRAAGKYEFLVRRVTYAFLDPIQMAESRSRNADRSRVLQGMDLGWVGHLRRNSNSDENLLPTPVNTKCTPPPPDIRSSASL